MTVSAVAHRPVRTRRLPPTEFPRRHSMLLYVGFGALAALAAWLRLPPTARDTLWAEDGRNFLQGAIDNGPFGSLFIPYAGYLHTIPRLLASAVVSLVPVSGWALAMTAGTCLITGALAAAILVATRDTVRWRPARILVALLVVLAPLAPREVLGNAANIHSLVMYALLWVAMARPRGRRSSIGLAIVALLGALTEVQSVLLLPLLLVGGRDRRRTPIRVGLLSGVVVQLAITLLFPRSSSHGTPDSPASLAYGYLINVVMPLGVPERAIGTTLAAVGPAIGIAILLVILLAFAFVTVHGSRIERIVVAALLIGSVGIYASSIIVNPNGFTQYAGLTHQQLLSVWLVRYGVVPSIMLAAIVPVAWGVAVASRGSAIGPSRAGRLVTVGLAMLMALLALSLALQFTPAETRRSNGPAWQPQLAAAREACESLPGTSRITLDETISWHVSVPCAMLTHARPGPTR
jgi:hypothetical protein